MSTDRVCPDCGMALTERTTKPGSLDCTQCIGTKVIDLMAALKVSLGITDTPVGEK